MTPRQVSWDRPPRPRDPRGEVLARGSPGPPESAGAQGLAPAAASTAEKHTEASESLKGARTGESPGRRKALHRILVCWCQTPGGGGRKNSTGGGRWGVDLQPLVSLRSCSLFGFCADRHLPLPSGRKPHLPPQEPAWSGSGQTGAVLPRGPGDCREHSREPCAPGLHPSSLCP